MNKKRKIRGKKRRLKTLVRRIAQVGRRFPEPHRASSFWHFHLPLHEDFLDRLSMKYKRLSAQMLMDVAHQLACNPKRSSQARVVVALTWPQLRNSQIIVFFDQEYFETFFERNMREKLRAPLQPSLAQQIRLSIPNTWNEQGVLAKSDDEDECFSRELWFYIQPES